MILNNNYNNRTVVGLVARSWCFWMTTAKEVWWQSINIKGREGYYCRKNKILFVLILKFCAACWGGIWDVFFGFVCSFPTVEQVCYVCQLCPVSRLKSFGDHGMVRRFGRKDRTHMRDREKKASKELPSAERWWLLHHDAVYEVVLPLRRFLLENLKVQYCLKNSSNHCGVTFILVFNLQDYYSS